MHVWYMYIYIHQNPALTAHTLTPKPLSPVLGACQPAFVVEVVTRGSTLMWGARWLGSPHMGLGTRWRENENTTQPHPHRTHTAIVHTLILATTLLGTFLCDSLFILCLLPAVLCDSLFIYTYYQLSSSLPGVVLGDYLPQGRGKRGEGERGNWK